MNKYGIFLILAILQLFGHSYAMVKVPARAVHRSGDAGPGVLAPLEPSLSASHYGLRPCRAAGEIPSQRY